MVLVFNPDGGDILVAQRRDKAESGNRVYFLPYVMFLKILKLVHVLLFNF